MRLIIWFIVATLIAGVSSQDAGNEVFEGGEASDFEWGYDEEDGPSVWPLHFPEGNGRRQSPINIDTNAAQDDRSTVKAFKFTYNKRSDASITKTTENFLVKFDPAKAQNELSGGFLRKGAKYQLANIHIHWSPSDTEAGSEHSVDGQHYPGEMHMVHFNKKYKTIDEALKNVDGVAVLGVFIKVGRKNLELQKVVNFLPKLLASSEHEVTLLMDNVKLDPKSLLPKNTRNFWSYSGSLTTPPLSEVVTWTVFKDPIEMSSDQFSKFRKLLSHNFRPVQPLNSRSIRKSFR